jgi:hypothetical protein
MVIRNIAIHAIGCVIFSPNRPGIFTEGLCLVKTLGTVRRAFFMDYSAGYRLGQIVGGMMVVFFVLAIVGGSIACLVMAIRTKKKRWIAGTVILGLPMVAFFMLFCVGLVAGITAAVNSQSGQPHSIVKLSDSALLTAPMGSLTGSKVAYEISLPSKNAWLNVPSANGVADIFKSHGDFYVMVIAENFAAGNPESVEKFALANLENTATEIVNKEAVPITIDGKQWLQFDVDAKVENIKVTYRYYVFADDAHTFQIVTFTPPAMFPTASKIFDWIAGSFKFPPSTPSAPAEHEEPAKAEHEKSDS